MKSQYNFLFLFMLIGMSNSSLFSMDTTPDAARTALVKAWDKWEVEMENNLPKKPSFGAPKWATQKATRDANKTTPFDALIMQIKHEIFKNSHEIFENSMALEELEESAHLKEETAHLKEETTRLKEQLKYLETTRGIYSAISALEEMIQKLRPRRMVLGLHNTQVSNAIKKRLKSKKRLLYNYKAYLDSQAQHLSTLGVTI